MICGYDHSWTLTMRETQRTAEDSFQISLEELVEITLREQSGGEFIPNPNNAWKKILTTEH